MRAWGSTNGPGRLHSSQSICRRCGLVFSNPVCGWAELEAFYRDDFWEQHWPAALSKDAAEIKQAVDGQRSEVDRIKAFAPGPKLLDVGSGAGGFLAAARDAGFDVWGIETSAAGVAHSREVLNLTNVLHGSVPDERLPKQAFDAVYAWHVIEHVVDLDAFVASLHSLLKPGGLLWIGTENYRNASQYLERAIQIAKGKPAPFATASEHTMLFDAKTLRDVLSRRGFDVLSVESYQPSLEEKMKTMHFRSFLSRFYFYFQHAANIVGSTGPLMRLVARRS